MILLHFPEAAKNVTLLFFDYTLCTTFTKDFSVCFPSINMQLWCAYHLHLKDLIPSTVFLPYYKSRVQLSCFIHTLFKTPVDVLSWACLSQRKWLRGKSHHHKWLVPRKIWSVEEPVTLLMGTKTRTSHCWSPEGEAWKKEVLGNLQWKEEKGVSIRPA